MDAGIGESRRIGEACRRAAQTCRRIGVPVLSRRRYSERLVQQSDIPRTPTRRYADTFLPRYLFVIFVTFCADVSLVFPGLAEKFFTEDHKGHEDKPWT